MQSQNYSFVVRVWLESTYSDGEVAMWRGSIERVGNDCRIYFSDLEGITQIIQTQIGLEASTPPAGWRLIWEHIRNGIRKFWKRILHQNPS